VLFKALPRFLALEAHNVPEDIRIEVCGGVDYIAATDFIICYVHVEQHLIQHSLVHISWRAIWLA
jgi:hypothetical protein